MITPNKSNRHAWLWWVSVISLSVGVAVYILLEPASGDPEVQRYRVMAVLASIFVASLSLIIGTSKRWFGKGL